MKCEQSQHGDQLAQLGNFRWFQMTSSSLSRRSDSCGSLLHSCCATVGASKRFIAPWFHSLHPYYGCNFTRCLCQLLLKLSPVSRLSCPSFGALDFFSPLPFPPTRLHHGVDGGRVRVLLRNNDHLFGARGRSSSCILEFRLTIRSSSISCVRRGSFVVTWWLRLIAKC